MARTVKVALQAEVGQYKRGMGEAEKATDKLSDAIDGIDGKPLDTAATKAKGLGDAVDDAADRAKVDFDEIARHAADMDRKIRDTETGMKSLAKAFAATGDPKILDAWKEQGRLLGDLKNVRKSLPSPADAVKGGAEMAGHVGTGFATTLRTALPAAANPAMLAAGAGAAPVFISAISSALSAGAGVAVLGVGLAAIAKDPVVKLRAAELGKNFSEGLQKEAKEAFAGPVLQGLDRLDAAGQRMTASLGKAFDSLGPHIDPFTQKVIGAGEAVTGSLVGAAEKSGPAMDGLGDAITLLGDGAAHFVGVVSDGGPEAANNLVLLAGATADLVKYSANLLDISGDLANNTWLTGPLLPLLKSHYKDAAKEAQNLKDQQAKIPPELDLTTRAANGQRDALTALSKEMKAQTDPAFALLVAQEKLKKAQDDAAAATKKHGSNSKEARAATRELALAALDLEAKAGALGSSFSGKLTPAMQATYRAAGLTEDQIDDVEAEFIAAKKAGDKFDGAFKAEVSSKGVPGVLTQLDNLLIRQQALNKGISVSAAASAFRKNAYAEGGWTGPGSKYQPAGVVHADEFVVRKESRNRIESRHPGLLDELNATGQLPGHADGGRVWPYPVTAANAHVMSLAQALSKVAPSFGNWPSSPSAQRGDSGVWRKVVQLINAGPNQGSFGNAYRPGDPKWHGSGRAVDWMGYNMDALAKYLAAKRPLELIHRTRNRDYAYTRGVNKGSFNNALMNAHRNHIHIAMAGGGVIREPVFGVGASGATYSLAERGPERVLSAGQTRAGAGGATTTVNLTVNAPVGSHPRDIGRQVVEVIGEYLGGGGELRVRGTKIF